MYISLSLKSAVLFEIPVPIPFIPILVHDSAFPTAAPQRASLINQLSSKATSAENVVIVESYEMEPFSDGCDLRGGDGVGCGEEDVGVGGDDPSVSAAWQEVLPDPEVLSEVLS